MIILRLCLQMMNTKKFLFSSAQIHVILFLPKYQEKSSAEAQLFPDRFIYF